MTTKLLMIAAIILGTTAPSVQAEPVYVDLCSGTYLGNGIVMTAGHCMETSNTVLVRKDKPKDDGDLSGAYKATLLMLDKVQDVAFVKIDKELYQHTKPDESTQWIERDTFNGVPWEVSKLACRDLAINDEVTMTGWPGGYRMTTHGYVASTDEPYAIWPHGQFVVMGAFYGSSGSGVYDKDGLVVATLNGMIPGSGLFYVVPIKSICDSIPRSIEIH